MAPKAVRSGLTLIELLVASAIMVMTVTALAVLAKAVQVGSDYSKGHGDAIQHARVTLERITRMANEATTSPAFPGLLVLAEQVDDHRYPDTLIVWHPSAAPADPEGLPRFDELVIFCPHPDRPKELIEVTAPGDTRTVPALDNQGAWFTEIDALKNSDAARRTVLTDLVRVASTDGTYSQASRRACVRFDLRLRPSDAQLAEYEAGNVDWKDLPWVQNIHSPSLGLRQVWLRIELQLMPGKQSRANNSGAMTAIPFLDSAAMHYTLKEGG